MERNGIQEFEYLSNWRSPVLEKTIACIPNPELCAVKAKADKSVGDYNIVDDAIDVIKDKAKKNFIDLMGI